MSQTLLVPIFAPSLRSHYDAVAPSCANIFNPAFPISYAIPMFLFLLACHLFLLMGTILTNHIFTFGSSSNVTTSKGQEYCDAPAKEFDLLPTSKSKRNSVLCNAEECQEDMRNISDALGTLPVPSLLAKKSNKCKNKMRPFAPTGKAKQDYIHASEAQAQKQRAKKNKTSISSS